MMHSGQQPQTENPVKAFFAPANAGKCSEAEKYLSLSPKAVIVSAGDIKKFAEEQTRDGKVGSVETLKVETRGETAKMHHETHYKDMQTKDRDVSLIKENGRWRITGSV